MMVDKPKLSVRMYSNGHDIELDGEPLDSDILGNLAILATCLTRGWLFGQYASGSWWIGMKGLKFYEGRTLIEVYTEIKKELDK